MKKSLFFAAVAALAVLACKKDEPVQVTPELSVNSTEITVEHTGGTSTIQVTSNVEWKVTSSASWFTVDPQSGNGNGTITVTVSPNEAYKERTDAISINCSAKRVSISVKQKAAPKPEVPVESKITEVKTADDFAKFAAAMDQYELSETVKLAADITITAPIDSLTCNFDGQNHTITLNLDAADLTTDDPKFANIGIFRKVNGAVKNLNASGSIKAVHANTEAATYHIGGIAGLAAKTASFENCTNNIDITLNNIVNTHHAGGIVGYVNPGVNIKGCKNTGKIVAVYEGGASKASQLGGIVGHIENSIKITDTEYEKGVNRVENCINEGEVSYTGAGTARIAGICGYVNNLNEATFKDCTNNGAVNNNATGYNDSNWAYVCGITGYYGTPLVGGYVLYEGCVNNGAITCDPGGSKLRCRVAGINGHASNSKQSPDSDGNGINTWELKNCTNNGKISLVNGNSNTRSMIGGIQAYSEPSGTVIIDGCTSNGEISVDTPQTNAKYTGVGGLLGGSGAINSRFTNNIITDKVVIKVTAETANVGLIAGNNSAFNTAVTGKVGAASITKGETTTVASSSNLSSLLFGVELGATATIDGVTFGN